MSAVPQPTIPIWHVKPDPDEPEFFGEEWLDMGAFPGPHRHSEYELRNLWSLVWKKWREERMCGEVVRYNRLFSTEWWREAIEECSINKPRLKTLKYVISVASGFAREGTPTERMARKLAEEAKANQLAACDVETSDNVRRFWVEKARPTTIDDVADDDPVFLRVSNILKGGPK